MLERPMAAPRRTVLERRIVLASGLMRLVRCGRRCVQFRALAEKPGDGMSSPNRQTFRRLVETAHWVVNCMTDDGTSGFPVSSFQTIQHLPFPTLLALGPDSDAWQAIVRVRFLHASVRRRLQAKWASNAEVILPINQLQNFATLLAICVQPFMQFPSLGSVAPMRRGRTLPMRGGTLGSTLVFLRSGIR
ncbi:hypothetical protein M427DRAFT_337160 [Gonapodya prolifera JEL478]|uniref:Uncharacterized protein n=1 Tax=Gonapodya prolifera (strain JEL478) TaxID=1344416 RepID=A0A139AE42_GONPJ|nr:hypothetical protein M427DRAFT_337160 [Gonapodya prolifera JEL478]|eukprot:KXS14705.1 hypothetical protein M427DRAFT_337160 [Gonapodya prolifera JEL478]